MRYTTNYNLDLYDLEDVASLADGYNHTIEKIDSLLYQLQAMIGTANESAKNLDTRVSSLEQRVGKLEAAQ